MASRSLDQPRAWQRMLSGRRLDLLNPSPLDIEIEDIAHGLARVARWNGQTHGAHSFSVAQHVVLVEEIARFRQLDLPPATLMTVLLHDAAEYVIGDMISPFKTVLADSYKSVEARLMRAIHMRFSIDPDPPKSIISLTKKADQIAAYYEATLLAGFEKEEAEHLFGKIIPLPKRILSLLCPMPTEMAQAQFLNRFHALEISRKNQD